MYALLQSNSTPKPTALESVRTFLQQVLRITTVDSRIFIGTFAGTDKPLNIILVNAEEYRLTQGPGEKMKVDEDGRYVGQVLLPWKMIVKVEVHEVGRDRSDRMYM